MTMVSASTTSLQTSRYPHWSNTHFSSRYSSPKLIKADSYSLTAASDVTEGGLEMISLYMASAFRGSVLASCCASLTEGLVAAMVGGRGEGG